MTCSLYLEIVTDNVTRIYELVPLDPDPKIAVMAWRLERDGEVHDVAILRSGEATCTCGDNVFRERKCKHIVALAYLGVLRK